MSARVLVVDDEEIVLRSCLRALGDSGHQADAVQSGAEALSRIEDGRYDVLVLDIMMPKMDGIEVLRRVKETHPDIEVIMITGLSQISGRSELSFDETALLDIYYIENWSLGLDTKILLQTIPRVIFGNGAY